MGKEHLFNHLFIDIETVPVVGDYGHLSTIMQEQWERKAKNLRPKDPEDSGAARLFRDNAAIFAEFGKVVCIGIGALSEKDGGWQMTLKAFTDDDEKLLLKRFCEAITSFTKRHPSLILTGHNIKEFDIPYICRRMVIHGMDLPDCMQLHGKKPWEVAHIDTMELWKFGDKKSFTSLALLAEVLGIPTPKDDINGSEVGRVYYEEHNLQRIADYCLKDVLTTARIFLRLSNIHDIEITPVIVATTTA